MEEKVDKKLYDYTNKKKQLTAAVSKTMADIKQKFALVSGTFPSHMFSIADNPSTMTVHVVHKQTGKLLDTQQQMDNIVASMYREYTALQRAVNSANSTAGSKAVSIVWYDGNIVAKYGGQVATRADVIASWGKKAAEKRQATTRASGRRKQDQLGGFGHSDISDEGGNTTVAKFDFGGYATRANLKCSDGRVISRDAFKDCDGQKVPLVWQHLRNDPNSIIGHAILENRPDGVYAYGKFNNTESAKTMKELVEHGDIDSLSIYANHLSQHGSNVVHGAIREVSLVVAGANPGAKIDNLAIAHEDGYDEELADEAVITTGLTLEHGEFEIEMENTTDDEPEVEHADDSEEDSQNEGDAEATVKEVFDSLTEDQKILFYAMVGQALEQGDDSEEDDEDEAEHSDIYEGGNDDMKFNPFEQKGRITSDTVLEHSGITVGDFFTEVNSNAQKYHGSFKSYLKESALEHGITDIESLFPDYKSLNNPPAWIGEPEAWVNTVWNGTTKTPFSRIKSAFADITKDEARARGYIKGKKKEEEQFSLLKRTTDPQTVYKLQKLDRDDIIDITDFDVVAWLKSEMRMKLQEELSRAILLGDGRLASDEGKIQETHIRSILNEDPFYSLKYQIDMTGMTDTTEKANAIIDGATMAAIDYKGSGNMTAFMSPQTLAYLKLAKDKNGRRLYNSVSEIASALGVGAVVEVPLMKDQTRTDTETSTTYNTLGILVNLRDYTIGADRGGATTMFDDFDIDYNKYTYLIETRCSGALIRPASAIVLETTADVAVG